MNSSEVTKITREKQFLAAVERGDFEYVKFLESNGADISCTRDDNGVKEDAVWIAIDKGYEEIAIHLIDNEKYDVNFCSIFGKTHLMLASQKAMIKVMEKLYSRGVDIYAQDSLGNLASMHACISGTVEALKFYIDRGHLDIFKYKNNNGETHLMWACKNGIKNGGNDVASYILSLNLENVFAKNKSGSNAFKLAFANDAYVILDELARYGIEKFEIYNPFVNVESVGCAKVFVKYGFDVNDINNNHETVLFRIRDVTNELQEYYMSLNNVDVNKKNSRGDTVITYLLGSGDIYWGRKLTKELIEKKGANVLIKGARGKTAAQLVREYDITNGWIFSFSTMYRYLKKVEKQQKRKIN